MKTGETRAIPSPRMPLRFASALALGAMVALSACSGTKTMPETGSAALAAEKQRADAAEEALEELRASLAAAQGALGADTTAQQRSAARTAIGDALGELREVRKTLEEQPASAAKTATNEALAAVVTALGAVDAALAATTESGMVSGAGVVVLAGMHTTLDRAQAAIDDAQAKLETAFEANPSGALRSTLSQAQALLTTAQVSLVPQLRQELTQAEGDAATQRARAAAAEAARKREKARADAAEDAAERVLEELRASLAAAQGALGSGTTAQQRSAARRAVVAAREDLGRVQESLEGQPASAAKTAAEAALRAVDTALTRTSEALAATNAAMASGAGVVVLASMHTSLDRAQAAIDAAQAALKTALAADPSDALRALLAQAQGTLTTAQVSLVPLLRQELAAAQADAADEKARADTYDPRVSLADALLPREERDVPRGDAQSITRTPRTGGADHRKLAIRTDPVPFATDKRVAAAGAGLVARDELPLRAITLRAAGRHFTVAQSRNQGRTRIHGDDGTPTAYSNTDGEVQSSLQLSADGATLKFGGVGVVYYDMQRQFNYFDNADDTTANEAPWWRYGPDGKLGDASAAAGDTMTASHARDLGLEEASGMLTADQATALQGYVTDNSGACWQADLSLCGDWAHDDLTIAFGTPSQSPHGEAAYYWKVRAPFTQLQRDTGLPDENNDGRPQDLGTYELWLSHYGGVDDKGTDTEDDDTHRYLEYAAYGLFTFLDGVVQTPSFLRQHAFAFGYDAFQDADNLKTSDLTSSIAATFTGHTMARQLITDGSITHVIITGADVLRGDVTLNACIGGTGCTGTGIPTAANRISGLISGLEELRYDGVWVAVTNDNIPMVEGDIAADGSFAGALDYPRQDANDPSTRNTWHYESGVPGEGGASRYGGNLYGPRDGLEAAGWWYVQPDPRIATDSGVNIGGIIGSFGAKCTEGCSSN